MLDHFIRSLENEYDLEIRVDAIFPESQSKNTTLINGLYNTLDYFPSASFQRILHGIIKEQTSFEY